MKCLTQVSILKPLVIYLVFSLTAIAVLPSNSYAFFVTSPMFQKNSSQSTSMRTEGIEKIQKVLESKIIGQRLMDLGLNLEEINGRLEQLTDEEIHYFATQLDALNAGGDTGFIIGAVILVGIVWLILHYTGKKIIIQKS